MIYWEKSGLQGFEKEKNLVEDLGEFWGKEGLKEEDLALEVYYGMGEVVLRR